MNRITISSLKIATSAAAVVVCALAASGTAQTADELGKIQVAMPSKAPAKPARPRKLLVFGLSLGYHHASIPYANAAFKIMGEKTGAFTADLTSDVAVFTPEKLSKYDAILLNNSTGEIFTTPSVQQALQSFVSEGKGLVGIHAAADSSYSWPGYGELLGGFFDGHPWHHDSTVTVKVEDPSNPIVASFGGKELTVEDEIYQFKAPYSRKLDHVLTGLDTARTDMTKKGIKRTDGDFPTSWVKPFGKGRVFYCSIGHNPAIYWNPVILGHYLAGIQFAMGDLKAPCQPGGQAPPSAATPAANSGDLHANVKKALSDLSNFKFGESRACLGVLDDAVRSTSGHADQRAWYAEQLADFLAKPDLDYAPREQALRRLALVSSEAQVPAIAKLLDDPDTRTADMAREALDSIGGPASDAAVLKVAGSRHDDCLAGFLNYLGDHRVAASVDLLKSNATSSSATVAECAIMSLGKIASPEAVRALAQVRDGGTSSTRFAANAGLSKAAKVLAAAGKTDQALPVFNQLLAADPGDPARLAGLEGVLRYGPKEASVQKALDSVLNSNDKSRQIAMGFLIQSNDTSLDTEISAKLNGATAEQKADLLNLLGSRGNRESLPAVLKYASGPDEIVKLAAVQALGRLGDQRAVEPLLETASSKNPALRTAAQHSLATAPSAAVDTVLIEDISSNATSAPRRLAAIQVVAERKSAGAMDALQAAAASSEKKVAAQAWKTIADIATDKDADKLLQLLMKAPKGSVLDAATVATEGALKKIKDSETRASKVLDALSTAPDSDHKAALFQIASKIGGAKVLAALRAGIANPDLAISEAAARALTDYPTAGAIKDVSALAKDGKTTPIRVLAVRAMARMAALPSKYAPKTVEGYAKSALDLAQDPEDKKIVIGELGDSKDPGMINILSPYVDQEQYRGEAVAALLNIAENTAALDREAASGVLEKIAPYLNDDQKKQIDKIKASISAPAENIMAWRVSGPYDVKKKKPRVPALLKKKFLPELATSGTAKWVIGTSGDMKKKAEALDLKSLLKSDKPGVAYVQAFIESPEARKAVLDFGSDDGASVWLNGVQVYSDPGTHSYKKWKTHADLDLNAGTNELMIKVAQVGGDWLVGARVVDSDHHAIPDVKILATPPQ